MTDLDFFCLRFHPAKRLEGPCHHFLGCFEGFSWLYGPSVFAYYFLPPWEDFSSENDQLSWISVLPLSSCHQNRSPDQPLCKLCAYVYSGLLTRT